MDRRLRRGALHAAAAAAAVALGAAAPELPAWRYEARPLTDGVTVLQRPDVLRPPVEGNVTVAEQADGLVVIDAGGSPIGGERLVAGIRRLSAKPVKALVYTHYHGDHNLGAGAFLQAWPEAEVISTAATRAHMSGAPMSYITRLPAGVAASAESSRRRLADAALSAAERERHAQLVADAPDLIAAYQNLRAWPATRVFEDRLVLDDAERPVELLYLGRANTDGDAVAWLPRQRVLVAGDIVVAPVPYGFGSFPGEWIGVLERLKGFDFAFLVPGHGDVQTDRAYVDRLIGLLQAVRNRAALLAAEGVSAREMLERADFADQTASFAGDDPWRRYLFRIWFLAPILDSARKEALGEPIVQGTG